MLFIKNVNEEYLIRVNCHCIWAKKKRKKKKDKEEAEKTMKQ
jgi:hypothetical protein